MKSVRHPILVVKQVGWWRPLPGWTKLNYDEVARGNPSVASCRGVFRMCRGFPKGCYAMPLGVNTPLYAELMRIILGVEVANSKN